MWTQTSSGEVLHITHGPQWFMPLEHPDPFKVLGCFPLSKQSSKKMYLCCNWISAWHYEKVSLSWWISKGRLCLYMLQKGNTKRVANKKDFHWWLFSFGSTDWSSGLFITALHYHSSSSWLAFSDYSILIIWKRKYKRNIFTCMEVFLFFLIITNQITNFQSIIYLAINQCKSKALTP